MAIYPLLKNHAFGPDEIKVLTTAYEEHAKLLRAILARKESNAISLLHAHIESSKAEIRHISLHKLALAVETTNIQEAQRHVV